MVIDLRILLFYDSAHSETSVLNAKHLSKVRHHKLSTEPWLRHVCYHETLSGINKPSAKP